MTLKKECAEVIERLLGSGFSKVIDEFDDPLLYPKDFLEECEHFMSRLLVKGKPEEV